MGVAWQEANQKKDIIVRSFKKCGISLAVDGSENSAVNIEGIPNYQMPAANDDSVMDFRLESDESDVDKDDDEDKFETSVDC
mgnify:FL=1